MPKLQALVDLPSTITIFGDERNFNIGTHFRWHSIKRFIYLACTFSSSVYNFDIYSKVCANVRIFDLVLCEATIGIAYMCMDCFIKQYTGRLTCDKHLNPLLRGVSIGTFLQTALWTIIHAALLVDFLRFFVAGLYEIPSWSLCQPDYNSSCIPIKDLMIRCQANGRTNFTETSAYFNYFKAFSVRDRTIMTSRFFVLALVWICILFFASVTEEMVIKIYMLAFICRTLSTIITILFILIATNHDKLLAISQMLDISSPYSYTLAMDHVCYIYGIGFLGLFDFGTISPYAMIDNAVVVFMVIFTFMSLLRSWIVRIMYLVLTKCVAVEINVTPHLMLFALLPLSTEFFNVHKLYVYYIYFNLVIATLAYVSMMTLTMSKFLQNEFRSIKHVYIAGMLCILGFGLSVPITVYMTTGNPVSVLVLGLNTVVLYLGGFKVAIIMWVYGVKRFSTDIRFWLRFKPTKFWITCWLLLPIVLLFFMANRVVDLVEMSQSITAYSWIALTIILVIFFQIKTIARLIVENNLAGLFTANTKYGPLDPDDRKKRQVYNEILRLRKCKHNCMLLDEMLDCYHVADYKVSTSSSDGSLMNIFEATTSKSVSVHN